MKKKSKTSLHIFCTDVCCWPDTTKTKAFQVFMATLR
jgi:hypothetical protein